MLVRIQLIKRYGIKALLAFGALLLIPSTYFYASNLSLSTDSQTASPLTGQQSASGVAPATTVMSLAPGSASIETITPTRVLDTRTSTGGHKRVFTTGETYSLPIQGQGAVPASGVAAILANVTVVAGDGGGYLTIFPSGQTRPLASNINFSPGMVVANQVLVPLGSDGAISIYSYPNNVNVVIDVSGWVGKGDTTAGGAVKAIQPVRILDSRNTNGGRNGTPLKGGETAKIQVLGAGGLPTSGVSAIFANLTVVPDATTGGYLTAFATGTPRPATSSINYKTGVVTANMVLIPVGADGTISIYAYAGSTHLVLDVQGMVASGDPTKSMGVQPVQQFRALDTRTTLGGQNGKPIGGAQTISVPILGVGSVPQTGVSAVIGHLISVGSSVGGYFTAYPSGYAKPLASSLNFTTNATVSNEIIIPVGADGSISIFNYAGTAHAVLDIQGWVASADLSGTGPASEFTVASLPTVTDPADTKKAETILGNATRYAMTSWWNGQAQTLLTANLDPSAQNSTLDPVRRLSMEALAVSTSLSTGIYDEAAVGVSKDVAKQRTIQLIDRVASNHVTNHLGGWGDSWQSPLWSGLAGRAAWYIWPDLPAATQQKVARMIEHEANYSSRLKIHYMRSASGTVLTGGDSGAEEVAWDTNAMQVALVMLPNHPRANVWLTETVRFSLAAWARPSDTSSTQMVNGAPISSWIKGSNVEADGTVVNHNRIASDYSTTTYSNLEIVPLFAMAGRQTPQAARSLLQPVYSAFRDVQFDSPPYDAPGGHTYVTDKGDIYYPTPNDWGSAQKLPYALADAQALAFGYGPSWAAQYLDLHMNAQLAMQARYSTGQTYDDDASGDPEYNYQGREEHTAQLASQLYLTLYLRDHGIVSFTDANYTQN